MTRLRSGQVADAAGVNLQTLRYYERVGLLAEPERTPGGHRMYPPEAVTVIGVIKTAQRLGFSLDEVRDLLEVSTGGRREPGLLERAAAKLAEVEKLADLEIVRSALLDAIANDQDSSSASSEPPLSGLGGVEHAGDRPGCTAGPPARLSGKVSTAPADWH